jgi:hypothetical protein
VTDTDVDRLATAERILRRERRRTVDEREAFDALRAAVRDTPTERDRPVSPDSPAPPVLSRPTNTGSNGTTAVRRAYERTVMTVPHYEEEYGDALGESLEAEFGTEVAVGLTDLGRLTPGLKRAVLDAAGAARTERDRFVEALDAEADSLRESGTRLAAIRDELGTLAGEPIPDFGAQEAVRARLGVLADDCDAVADDRQAILREWDDRFDPPAGVPDLPRYLYTDLDATYPVLATVAEVGEHVARLRRRVEREMADPPRAADAPGTSSD